MNSSAQAPLPQGWPQPTAPQQPGNYAVAPPPGPNAPYGYLPPQGYGPRPPPRYDAQLPPKVILMSSKS